MGAIAGGTGAKRRVGASTRFGARARARAHARLVRRPTQGPARALRAPCEGPCASIAEQRAYRRRQVGVRSQVGSRIGALVPRGPRQDAGPGAGLNVFGWIVGPSV
ncbi:MAG: hypothetical protein QOH56_3244 [Pseudonocardiales bacterium]|nr:hypothetical protein [Pseudonocardiales bacterium]